MKKVQKIMSIVLFCLAGIMLVIGVGTIVWERTGHFKENWFSQNKKEEHIVNFEPIPGYTQDTDDNQIKPEEKTEGKETVSEEQQPEQEPSVETEPEPEAVRVENPYKDWFLKNSDMAAWLKIPDTIVDYPVMWTPEDEEHYLYLNFDGVKQKGGCLILDTDTCMDPLTTNLIIHGHNNKNQMFGDLYMYEEKTYRDAHPYIYLYGKDYQHVYEVMAVFRSQVFLTTDSCFKYYNFYNAYTQEQFNYFYDNVKSLQYYETGVTAEFGDRFLTLSTCSYHVTNGRFVVVAKEIEQGDVYEPFENKQDE